MRPLDWMPLAETDPLPGDPDAIAVEAVRLSRLSEDMRLQAARLREIGSDTTLVGDYADSLRTASGELAQDLEKVSGRYKRVGSALKDWAPELAVAQAETLTARSKALEAEQLRSAHSDAPTWGAGWPNLQLVPTNHGPGLDEANQMFAEARRMLRDTLDHAQARGAHYANLIDDANDIFKDGRWDNFKDWADRNADWIDGVTTALGWVATGAAIAAIFIPGVNVLVWTAVGLTVASGLSHTMLAATGNGSWLDVGLDVFALLTFGIGLAAAKGLTGAQQTARAIAAEQARRTAVSNLANTATNTRAVSLQALQRAGNQGARQVTQAPLARASNVESFLVGGRTSARELNDLAIWAGRYSAAPGMTEAVARGSVSYSAAQMSHLSGISADAQGKAADVAQAARWIYSHRTRPAQ